MSVRDHFSAQARGILNRHLRQGRVSPLTSRNEYFLTYLPEGNRGLPTAQYCPDEVVLETFLRAFLVRILPCGSKEATRAVGEQYLTNEFRIRPQRPQTNLKSIQHLRALLDINQSRVHLFQIKTNKAIGDFREDVLKVASRAPPPRVRFNVACRQ